MPVSRRKLNVMRKPRQQVGAQARKRSRKIVSKIENAEVNAGAFEKRHKGNGDVRSNDMRGESSFDIIGSGETTITEEKNEMTQSSLGEIYDRVMPIRKHCFNGETSGNLSDDKKERVACKPCSVVLERLSKEELANLLLGNDGEVVKKKKRTRKRFRYDYYSYLRNKRNYNWQQKKLRTLTHVFEEKIEEDAEGEVQRSDDGKKINCQLRLSNEKPFAKITEGSRSIRAAFEHLGHTSSSSKRFKLSLKRVMSNTEDNRWKISPADGTNKDGEIDSRKIASNNCSKSKSKRLSLKRNLINIENGEAGAPKQKKHRKARSAAMDDCITSIASDSIVNRSSSVQFDSSGGPGHRNSNERLNLNVESETPMRKNMGTLPLKLTHSPDSSEDEEKVDVNSLDNYGGSCARVSIYQRKTSQVMSTKTTTNNMNRFKSKKITDYFVTIVKKSILPENNARALNRVASDSELRKKHGICKEVVVSLVDLKNLKIQTIGDEGAASQIEKLTNEDAESFLTPNSLVTPAESTPPSSTSSRKENLPENENESSTMEERSSAGVHLDAKEGTRSLFDAYKSLIGMNKPSRVEKCSPIESGGGDSLTESLTILGGTLSPGNKRGKHLYNDEEDLERDWTLKFPSKSLSKSNPMLQSSLVDDEESGYCSPVFGGRNGKPTSSRRKAGRSYKRSSSLSPRKSRRLVIDEITTSGSQTYETEICIQSDKVSERNSDETAMRRKKEEEAERRKEDTPAVDEGLKVCPTLASVMKLSPPNKGNVKSEASPQKLKNRLPLNTMTCLNFSIINENGSYLMGLDSGGNDIAEVGGTENEETVENNAETDSLEKINSVNAALTGESRSQETGLEKSLEKSDKPVCAKMENCTRKENASASGSRAAEKKTDNGNDRSSSAVLVLERIACVQNYNRSIPVFFVDESIRKSDASDSHQEGNLVIDESEAEKDATVKEEENTIPDKLREDSATILNHECVMCKKKFGRIEDLANHLQVHIKDTNSCILCDKKLSKDNAVKHYLEHCSCADVDEVNRHACDICNRKFRTVSAIKHHLKLKHKIERRRMKTKLHLNQSNQCTICQKNFKSKYELSKHLFSHTEEEFQNAYKAAKANQKQSTQPVKSSSKAKTSNSQEEPGDSPSEEKCKNLKEATTTGNKTPAIPAAATPSCCAVSICMCHKDERLQISGSVIIELALTCEQCKTFFKTRKCFKDHYVNAATCKWREKAIAIPAMFCNKCCVILSSLQEMHSHLQSHAKLTAKTKSSFLCKLCNIYFFGIGSLFYTHWFNHCDNPLFVADHSAFPNNFKVKIVEPESIAHPNKDDLMGNLLVAEYQCQACQDPFETEEDMRKHLIASNSCSKKVNSRNKAIESPKSVFKIICSICNKEFNDKPGFDDHVKEHKTIAEFLEVPKLLTRPSAVDQRECKICKTEFATVTIYKEHFRRHEIIREKFICNYCSAIVNSMEKFERHSLEHKGTHEKPVSCKVVFATSKFHCTPCKLWFDSETTLDEHLATHKKQATANSKSAKSAPAPAGKEILFVTSEQNDSRLVGQIGETPAEKKSTSNTPLENDLSIFQISDDSSSSEVEIIIPEKPVDPGPPSKESIVRNSPVQKKKEAPSSTKKSKPSFLRVKNLKELLPYPCTTCKMEFDTHTKLSNHVCNKSEETREKDSTFKHTCTICNNFKCNSDDDMKLHSLSHSSLRSVPLFDKSWFNVLSIQSDKPLLKCNICAKYGCESVTMMRDHFINVHPDLYRPVYTCRVCQSFNTTTEQEIRRHEAAHFRKSSDTPPLSSTLDPKTSTSAQPTSVDGNSKNSQNATAKRAVDRSTDRRYNQPPIMPVTNSPRNYQQTNAMQSIIDFANNAPQLQRGCHTSSNFERTIPTSSPSSLGHNTLAIQQQTMSSVQLVENRSNVEQRIPVLIPTNLLNNSLPFTSVSNFQNIPPNLVPSNSNGNSSSDQPIAYLQQWATSSMQPLQNQNPTNNNNSPFNNAGNVVRTVINTVYRCCICKSFETSSKKLLKAHETLHDYTQLDKPSQLCYPCTDCPNFSCTTQEQLNNHFATFHGTGTATNPPLMAQATLKCSNCSLTFVSSNELAQHVYKSHTYFIVNRAPNEIQQNIYPFGCHLCSIRFSNVSYLLAHLNNSHPNDKEASQKIANVQAEFKCEICQLYLVSQVALNHHMRIHNVVYQ